MYRVFLPLALLSFASLASETGSRAVVSPSVPSSSPHSHSGDEAPAGSKHPLLPHGTNDGLVLRHSLDAKNEFPLVGLLADRERRTCTATVYPKKPCVIITSRHCTNLTSFVLGSAKTTVTRYRTVGPPDHDLAIGILADSFDVPKGAQFTLAMRPFSNTTSTTIRVVGFGDSPNKSLTGRKQVGTLIVPAKKQRMQDGRLELPAIPGAPSSKYANESNVVCIGDSGGPGFDEQGKLVSVTSAARLFAPGVACVSKNEKSSAAPLNVRWDLSLLRAAIDSPKEEPPGFSQRWSVSEDTCRFLNGDLERPSESEIRANFRAAMLREAGGRISENKIQDAWAKILALRNLSHHWHLPTRAELDSLPKPAGPTPRVWLKDFTGGYTFAAEPHGRLFRYKGTVPSYCEMFDSSIVSPIFPHLEEIYALLDEVSCPTTKPLNPLPQARSL